MPTAVQRGFISEELYNQFLKDADLLKAEGLIADEDYTKIVSGSFQEAQDALSRSYGASDKAKSKLLKVGDLDEFSDVVETPSGLVFGFPKLPTAPKETFETATAGLGIESILAAADRLSPIEKPVEGEKPLPLPKIPPPGDLTKAVVAKAQEVASKRTPKQPFPEAKAEIEQAVIEPIRTSAGDVSPIQVVAPVEPKTLIDALLPQQIETELGQQLNQGLTSLLVKEKEDGTYQESAVGYVARLLGTFPEIAIGAVEAGLTDKTLSEAVVQRVAKGRGFTGAGYDIAEAISDATGLEKGSPEREVLGEGLSLVGFIGDILVPLDFWVGDAVKGVSTALELATGGARTEGGAGAFIPIGARSVDSALGTAVNRFSTNPENLGSATQVIRDIAKTGETRVAPEILTDLGLETINPNMIDNAAMDALRKAETEADKAGVIQTWRRISTKQSRGASPTPFQADLNKTFETLQDISASSKGEELLAESLLKTSGQKQVLEIATTLTPNKVVPVGDKFILGKDLADIGRKVKEFFAPTDALKQVETAVLKGETPSVVIPDDIYSKLKQQAERELKINKLLKDKPVFTPAEYNDLVNLYTRKLIDTSELTIAKDVGEKALKKAGAGRTITTAVAGAVEPIAKTAKEAVIRGVVKLVPMVGDKLRESAKAAKEAGEIPADIAARLKKGKEEIASIQDTFNKAIRKGVSEGKTPAQATADTIVDSYKKPPTLERIESEGGILYRDPTRMEDPLTEDQVVGELFDDFIRTIYGGEERVVEARQLITGTAIPKKGLDPQKAFRTFTSVIDESGGLLNGMKKEFVGLIKQGKNKEAIEYLGKVHRFLEGKSLDILDKQVFSKLGKEADYLVGAKPVITADRFIPSLLYTYVNRRAANIVADVATRPTPEIIKGAKTFETRVGNTISDFLEIKTNPLIEIPEIRRRFILDLRSIFSNNTPDGKALAREIAKGYDLSPEETRLLAETISDDYNNIEESVRTISTSIEEQAQMGSKEAEAFLKNIEGKDTNVVIMDAIATTMEGLGTRLTPALRTTLNNTKTNRFLLQGLEKSVSLASSGRTIENMKYIPKTDIPDEILIGDAKTIGEMLEAVKGQSLAPRTKAFISRILTASPLDIYSKAETLAKQGFLAGAFAPNLAYHFQNYLSADSIIYSTLGAKRALGAVRDKLFLDPATDLAVANLYGIKFLQDKAPEWYRKLGNFETPSGKVYSPEQIADIIAKNGIAQTRASLGLTERMLDDMVRWSGKTLSGEDIGKIRQTARNFDPTQPNIWFELANYTDTRFRTGVLQRALKEGKTEAEAIQEARDALFDYSKLSKFERDYVNRIFWYWNFERNAIAQAGRNILTNPRRFANDNKSKMVFSQDDKAPQDFYNENRAFLELVKETKANYAVYGPGVPQAEAMAKAIDYMSPVLFFAQGELGRGVSKGVKNVVGRISSPLTSGLLALGGVQINFGEFSEPGTYIDPRLIGWARVFPSGVFGLFSLFGIELEEVPKDKITPDMITIEGKAYRIPYADKQSRRNYNLFLEVLKTAGLQRALRDYAPILVKGEAGEQTPVSLEVNRPLYEMLRDIGAIKVQREKTGKEIEGKLRERQIREIEER